MISFQDCFLTLFSYILILRCSKWLKSKDLAAFLLSLCFFLFFPALKTKILPLFFYSFAFFSYAQAKNTKILPLFSCSFAFFFCQALKSIEIGIDSQDIHFFDALIALKQPNSASILGIYTFPINYNSFTIIYSLTKVPSFSLTALGRTPVMRKPIFS